MDAIQGRINDVHRKQLDSTRKLALECGTKKNAIFAERTQAIAAKMTASQFWPRVFNGHPDFQQQLLGPFDDSIFASLEDFSVTHLEKGVRIDMKFKPNDYFTNDVLWYEEKEGEAGNDPLPTVSGINWKPGKEPSDEVPDQQQQASNPWAMPPQQQAGQRRDREEDKKSNGRSFFSFFEPIPAPPQPEQFKNTDAAAANNNNNNSDNSESDEEGGDGDVFEAACDDWEDMLDERREIARCVVEEIWEDPGQYLQQQQK